MHIPSTALNALITAFLKKTTNDKYYQDGLRNKVKDYRKIEESLKKCLADEEFIRENQRNVETLYQLLGNFNTDEEENKRGNIL